MNWTLLDFTAAAVLLGLIGLALVWLVRGHGAWATRLADFGIVGANVLLFWINGAVGLIGAETHPANTAYLALPVLAVCGALWRKSRPDAPQWTSLVAALVMAGIGGVALIAGWGQDGARWPLDIIVITGVFVAGFLCAAGLYRRGLTRQAASSRSR